MYSRAGDKHPHFKGGWLNRDGYRMISIHGKHYLEHRLILERHLGRKLTSVEVVHHADGNRLNNALSNLVLLPNQSAHMHEHDYSISAWAREYDCCIQCGTTERAHGGYGLCNYCYNKWRESQSWQGEYSRCKTCGSTERSQASKGLCTLCYQRTRAPHTYEWSRDHPRCVECGTTERKHEGKGECTRCYWRRTTREKRAK